MIEEQICARTQTDMAFLDSLLEARDTIKEHRRNRCDEVADLKYTQVLRSFNTWLDEAGMRRARERADQAGRDAAKTAGDIDTVIGF